MKNVQRKSSHNPLVGLVMEKSNTSGRAKAVRSLVVNFVFLVKRPGRLLTNKSIK